VPGHLGGSNTCAHLYYEFAINHCRRQVSFKRAVTQRTELMPKSSVLFGAATRRIIFVRVVPTLAQTVIFDLFDLSRLAPCDRYDIELTIGSAAASSRVYIIDPFSESNLQKTAAYQL
jgi:hypothetical protein